MTATVFELQANLNALTFTVNGAGKVTSTDAYASDPTQLILDLQLLRAVGLPAKGKL